MSAVPDTDKLLVPLVAAGICAAGMAVLVAGIALALGTTGHDWYAAWKLTLAEAMLGVGFSDYGDVEYRTAAGETVSVERYRFAYVMYEAWSARRQIFSLAADRAVLGACTGLALFAMWMGVRAAVRLRRFASGSGAVIEPAPRVRRGYTGRIHRLDDWSDGELIAALTRRSGRFGVLLVSSAEVERLAEGGNNAAGQAAAPRESLPPARPPSLSPPTSAEPAKPAPSEPGSGPDTTRDDDPTGDESVVPRREPGEQFF